MKKLILILTFFPVFCFAQHTPSYERTQCLKSDIQLGEVKFSYAETFDIGDLIWSAPVIAKYCEKETFDPGKDGGWKSDCNYRSMRGNYGDAFSWCMVAKYARKLCPHPWRVPTAWDIYYTAQIIAQEDKSWFYDNWMYSGHSTKDHTDYSGFEAGFGAFWSGELDSGGKPYYVMYGNDWIKLGKIHRSFGIQLRCVKGDVNISIQGMDM
jgi:hypothetical protein